MNVKRFLLITALIAAIASLAYGDGTGFNLGSFTLPVANPLSNAVNTTSLALVPEPATMAMLGVMLICLFNWQNRSGDN